MEAIPVRKAARRRAPSTSAAVGGDAHLGARLRGLRGEAGLSMSELARRAGVSVGMISQIERRLANPSVRTLERLRRALGVPLTSLLEGGGAQHGQPAVPEYVRRAAQRPHFAVGAGGLAKALLSPHGDHDLQFMLIDIPPRTRSEEILVGPGEKAGLVLDGEIVLTVGSRVERLRRGDSFQFSSLLPHGVENPGGAPAQVLWIMNTKPPVIYL